MTDVFELPEKVAGEPDLTRAAVEVYKAFKDQLPHDATARWLAPSKIDIEKCRVAILANEGRWREVAAWISAVTRKATLKGDPVGSVRYGLAAWDKEQERKRREREKRGERQPDTLNPAAWSSEKVEEVKSWPELNDEEQAAVLAKLAEIRAKLGG